MFSSLLDKPIYEYLFVFCLISDKISNHSSHSRPHPHSGLSSIIKLSSRPTYHCNFISRFPFATHHDRSPDWEALKSDTNTLYHTLRHTSIWSDGCDRVISSRSLLAEQLMMFVLVCWYCTDNDKPGRLMDECKLLWSCVVLSTPGPHLVANGDDQSLASRVASLLKHAVIPNC